jgi:uncharacterized protein (DUF362 family)
VRDYKVYLENVLKHATAEGGWGYSPGQAVHLEPTCLALLALSGEGESYRDAIIRGLSAVQRAARPDGAYRFPEDREELVWPTALVLFLNASGIYPDGDAERTVGRLLSWESRKPDESQSQEIHDIDVGLMGWPWAENNFAWVEPTSWACLALRRAGYGDHARVQEGLRLLVNRAFDDGGVNYGNRLVLGKRTEPIPGPTSLMLLALQGHGHEPRVAAAVAYLLKQAVASEDIEHLCWAKLALDCHGDQPGVKQALPVLDDRIVAACTARNATAWLRPAILREALPALALATEKRNPFRLPTTQTSSNGTHLRISPAPTARRKPWGQRLASAFRGLAIEAAGRLRQTPPQTAVHIAKVEDYNGDLVGVLQRQYASFRERVPLAGKRVVLKPNLVEYHRNKVINTHPHVIAAAIELCQREGAAEVIVAEGPGHWRNVEYLVQASGLGDVLRHYKVSFKDLNHDEPLKTPNLGRLTGLESLFLSKTIASADVVISLPKAKTHHWAGATLSLKNLFGTLPGICYGWPKNELHWRGIDNSIIDIALTRTPDLAIVDGIVGMEGDGPINGTPKPLGALIMGADLVAVDATCCRLMQLDPERIKYLVVGYQKKLGLLGEAEIQQLGETIASLAQPFDTVDHFHPIKLARSA